MSIIVLVSNNRERVKKVESACSKDTSVTMIHSESVKARSAINLKINPWDRVTSWALIRVVFKSS